jgi:hypothetical protein
VADWSGLDAGGALVRVVHRGVTGPVLRAAAAICEVGLDP